MKIRDVMSKDVQVARPEDTLQTVAGRMAAGDFGFIPVADGDRLIGALTDRDIVVRGVASGAGLGLIDIARRAGAPLEASLTPAAGEGQAVFSLSVVI